MLEIHVTLITPPMKYDPTPVIRPPRLYERGSTVITLFGVFFEEHSLGFSANSERKNRYSYQ